MGEAEWADAIVWRLGQPECPWTEQRLFVEYEECLGLLAQDLLMVNSAGEEGSVHVMARLREVQSEKVES